MPPSHASGIPPKILPTDCQGSAMYWQAGRSDARIKRASTGIKRDVRRFGVSLTVNLHSLRMRLEPALRQVFHFYWRFAPGLTPGGFPRVPDGPNRRVFG